MDDLFFKKNETGMKDYEYLLHHIEVDDNGKEKIHQCRLCDHIANMFVVKHLIVKDGKVYVNGKEIKKNSIYHIITGLEPKQDVCWSDKEAKEHNIAIKKMKDGMKFKAKAREW